MRIVDCHAHIYPEKIAVKATAAVGDFYDFKAMSCLGTSEELLKSCAAAGIERCWVHSVATNPAQVRPINEFIAGECENHPEFIGFGTLHPGLEDIQGEVDYLAKLGLCGVKLHPDFQKFNIDDESALPIYEAIAGRLPLIVHTGDYRYTYSHPRRLARVLDMFPKLDCVAAHFGGWSIYDEGWEYLGKKRCWADTSSTIGFIDDIEHVRKLASKWGSERLLFGCDFPMWDHIGELERFKQIGFTDDELERVLHKNAEEIISRVAR